MHHYNWLPVRWIISGIWSVIGAGCVGWAISGMYSFDSVQPSHQTHAIAAEAFRFALTACFLLLAMVTKPSE